MKTIIKNVLFRAFVGGLMYGGMEILLDNTSDRTMILTGALAFIIGGEFSIYFKRMSMRMRCFWIANIITTLEYIAGVLFNSNYTIWDYRNMEIFNIPLHLNGHICFPFWILWFIGIAPLIIWMTDKLKDEEIDISDYYKELFNHNRT